MILDYLTMLFIRKIARCSKITNFYRDFVNDVKSTTRRPKKQISLNIIGCGAHGESASVSLSVSNCDTYLFNCGEDCQRLLNSQCKSISNIKHIFITQTKWNCIGGISILSKIINESQKRLPIFHGPRRLYKCIKRILCLSILSELDFQPIHCNEKNFFEDDLLRIDFIPIEINSQCNHTHRLRDDNEVFAFVATVKTSAENDNKIPSDTGNDRVRFMGMLSSFGSVSIKSNE